MKKALLFLLLWLCAGFSLGTSTLLGPVRWIAAFCRAHPGLPGLERGAIVMVIVLLVSLSAITALILWRAVVETLRREVRYGIPALAIAAAAGAVWLWMTPSLLRDQSGAVTEAGMHFTFGPYPDEDRLRELKDEGYTAVVPLLHPAVIPFEPELLLREKAAAERVGLEVIHLPMLPWVSANSEALERVRALAKSGRGRYYVHCYLGKDRVQLVRRVVEEETREDQSEALVAAATLSGHHEWERGEVVHLDDRVHLTPYPTEREFLRYFAGGEKVQVVSLLDDRDPDDRLWWKDEERFCRQYRLACLHLSLTLAPYDPQAVLRAAARVRGLAPGTIAVHDFLAPASGHAPIPEAFLMAYRSGRPPLPPSSCDGPLAAGRLEVVAPHVAVGPRPGPSEFGAVLLRCGVREAIAVGEIAPRALQEDREAASEVRMPIRAAGRARPAELVERLDRGGPYYLYGDVDAALRAAIAARFGPPIPPEVRPEAAALLAAVPLPPQPASGVAQGVAGAGAGGPATAVASIGRGTATGDAAPGSEGGGAADGASHEAPQPATAVAAIGGGAVPGAADAAPRHDALMRAALARFLSEGLPGIDTVILLGPFLLLFAAAAAGAAAWIRIGRGGPVAYSRKTFHFAIFTMAGLLQALGGLKSVVLFGALVSLMVLYAVARGDGYPFYEALARPADAPRRTLFIVVPLLTTAAGGVLANLFFGAFAVVGYLVGGWGDAVGEPVGAAFGKHRYRVPSMGGVPAVRSLEGSAAVFAAGTMAAFCALMLRGTSPLAAAGAAVACGAAGAIVEAVSTHGADNLTVQVAAAGAAFLLLA